mgnify:CR=1 FL=1
MMLDFCLILANGASCLASMGTLPVASIVEARRQHLDGLADGMYANAARPQLPSHADQRR